MEPDLGVFRQIFPVTCFPAPIRQLQDVRRICLETRGAQTLRQTLVRLHPHPDLNWSFMQSLRASGSLKDSFMNGEDRDRKIDSETNGPSGRFTHTGVPDVAPLCYICR